ncbi:EAL domain-containing protein, partial [Arthrospira platensis SPKY1]|nr:EAL domain-containing protein [Arthrospira platensis SPKY1]
GYSSFSTLRNLPISTVKIDRTFVEQVTDRAQDAALVSGMISLAHQLGLTVVAEGVETQAQMDFLRDHHCDQGQGYFIARPLPLEGLCDFLQQRQQTGRQRGSGTA